MIVQDLGLQPAHGFVMCKCEVGLLVDSAIPYLLRVIEDNAMGDGA